MTFVSSYNNHSLCKRQRHKKRDSDTQDMYLVVLSIAFLVALRAAGDEANAEQRGDVFQSDLQHRQRRRQLRYVIPCVILKSWRHH